MRSEFRFPRSTTALMSVILAGVILAIEKGRAVQASVPFIRNPSDFGVERRPQPEVACLGTRRDVLGKEADPIAERWGVPHRVYWFFIFSACRSRPNWIRRSISLGYDSPEAAHNLGYMLIEVNPGMVLISFR